MKLLSLSYNFDQQFTYGVVSERFFVENLQKFCRTFAEICGKININIYIHIYLYLYFIASGKGAEILRKVCRNFVEICENFLQ